MVCLLDEGDEGGVEQGTRVYVVQQAGVPVDVHLLVEGVQAGVPFDVYPVVVDRFELARPMMWGMLSRGV